MSVKSVKFSTPLQSVKEQHTFPKTPHPHKRPPASSEKEAIKNDNHLSIKPALTDPPKITPFLNPPPPPPPPHGSKVSVHAETGQLQNEHYTSTKKKSSPTVKATVVAEKLRQQANSTCLNYIRTIKYQVAKLHEHLLKIEEEIKQANKGRRTLEIAIQEARKSLSTNQQSLSNQQKRTRGNEDSIVRVLREEAKSLSRSKRELESRLQAIKHQLHSLDNVRKMLKTKISSLSKTLQLDAQNYKLYDGPVKQHNSSERHYATKYQKPTDFDDSQLPMELLTNVNEVIQSSKQLRGGIKSLVTLAHTNQMDAHKKVNTAISKHKEDTEAQKRSLILEKGHLRLQQNSIAHEAHTTEITLGLVSGPVSEQYKSVAEKQDRPLSRLRPASALDEICHAKETKAKLFRHLSASHVRGSSVSTAEQNLTLKCQEQSMSVGLDSQMLRVRRMSLDNRWVS